MKKSIRLSFNTRKRNSGSNFFNWSSGSNDQLGAIPEEKVKPPEKLPLSITLKKDTSMSSSELWSRDDTSHNGSLPNEDSSEHTLEKSDSVDTLQDICIDRLFQTSLSSLSSKSVASSHKDNNDTRRNSEVSDSQLTEKGNDTPFVTPNVFPDDISDTVDIFLSPEQTTTGNSPIEIVCNSPVESPHHSPIETPPEVPKKPVISTPNDTDFFSPTLSQVYAESIGYEASFEDSRSTEELSVKKKRLSFSGFKSQLQKKMNVAKQKSKDAASFGIEKLRNSSRRSFSDRSKGEISLPIPLDIRSPLIPPKDDENFRLMTEKELFEPTTPNYDKFAKYKDKPPPVYEKPETGSIVESFEELAVRTFESLSLGLFQERFFCT
ncbi:hypothetical protein BCV72DRAFT_339658 [Rhizopus microsporus var. microsporus]|uniref:Uncharacterized protein n=2 Tax=Rhizopus microsporus TaxID=58291 RepID=A0A2G4SP40_RHIZD|nr:uncharacterized protein RHIMIDRAFT_293333 [Rhizopus microsporus ATCC 52813]ORE01090.1 hypothetical protein BCV72DRAFT_339658 [Rhizopus microsporus var. microsporus]PHZ10505.1 hypothetical protein RHIMIDRAFT_293333 [Rhizopus microsporus ATCC 52813]